jgi:hypothetical protein
VLLLLHGATHAFFPSYGSYESWLLGDSAPVATLLFVVATTLLVGSGLAAIFNAGLWKGLAFVGAVESLVLLLMFWEPGLAVGAGIDAVIVGLLSWDWRARRR